MQTTILETVVGSTLHGTAVDDGLEDLDLMAIVVEDLRGFAGFGEREPGETGFRKREETWVERTKPEGVRSEAGDVDRVAHGLHKYLRLALKGNPTCLLPLFADGQAVRSSTPAGAALQAMAPLIVSKQVYGPFRHYMVNQWERLMGTRGQLNVTRPELVERYGYDTKYAGHIVRLGLQGIELLSTGRLTLPMRKVERDLVISVRTGGFTLDQVSAEMLRLKKELDLAYIGSQLLEEPDFGAVEAWMLATYAEHWAIAP